MATPGHILTTTSASGESVNVTLEVGKFGPQAGLVICIRGRHHALRMGLPTEHATSDTLETVLTPADAATVLARIED